MDPLTAEELDWAENKISTWTGGPIFAPVPIEFQRRLIAAARASIPRPISEAPKDGTTIVAFCPTFYRGKGGWVIALFQDGEWWAVPSAFKIDPTKFIPIPGEGGV